MTLVYVFIIYITLKLNSLIFGINNKLIITLSLVSLGIYFLSISYSLLDKYKNYLNPLKYGFVFGIKKVYILLPIFLLFSIVLSFLIALNIYISSSLFTNIFIFTTIILLIVILITEVYRILLVSILGNYTK